VKLGKGGITLVQIGDGTVAETKTPRELLISYKVLCKELTKVHAVVKAAQGPIEGQDLKKRFPSSPLAYAADQNDWKNWAEAFSTNNSDRGKPKGVALVFLEQKTGLDRSTISSYLSRAKNGNKR
jgi:hypothetical protein